MITSTSFVAMGYASQPGFSSSGVRIAHGTPVHLRHIRSILLAGAFVVLAASSSTAQVLTTSTSSSTSAGSRVELTFATPPNGGQSCLVAASEDNIVWGTFIDLSTGAMCGPNAAADDNIVWGTSTDDFDNIVWGTSADEDNIVWGTAFGDENIVWGTDFGDNIVWGTGTASAF
jgi:hypothetical protein